MKGYQVDKVEKLLERVLRFTYHKTKIKRTPYLDGMIIRNYIVTQKIKGNTELYNAYLQYIKNKTEKIGVGMSNAGGMGYVVGTYQFDFDIAKAKLDVIKKYQGEEKHA